jgi:hypothetical protein
MNQWRVHDTATVKAGRYAGLAGTVRAVKSGASGVRVQLHIHGVFNGDAVNVVRWFAARELESRL